MHIFPTWETFMSLMENWVLPDRSDLQTHYSHLSCWKWQIQHQKSSCQVASVGSRARGPRRPSPRGRWGLTSCLASGSHPTVVPPITEQSHRSSGEGPGSETETVRCFKDWLTCTHNNPKSSTNCSSRCWSKPTGTIRWSDLMRMPPRARRSSPDRTSSGCAGRIPTTSLSDPSISRITKFPWLLTSSLGGSRSRRKN